MHLQDESMPKVSVIIPCYNQGIYIDEAVETVLSQTCQDFEIIIVNDGSTDEFTNDLLGSYRKPKARVIHTTNQGLPSARNNGIKEAAGEYILPLDADDRIGSEYLEEAVKILDQDKEVGIVYCEAELFGEATGKWDLPPYSLERMLAGNIIFCTSFFRKADWARVGGFDPRMVKGWEDYELWISLIELGVSVRRIDKVLFYYRLKPGSMVQSLSRQDMERSFEVIFNKHRKFYEDNVGALFDGMVHNHNEVVRVHEIMEDLRKEAGALHSEIHNLRMEIIDLHSRINRLETETHNLHVDKGDLEQIIDYQRSSLKWLSKQLSSVVLNRLCSRSPV
jgi:glycosyltransferase involved in cell wall biosynthesis